MTFISYARNLEDVLLWRAFKNLPSGFYIDVGAGDPVVGSVTNAFYEKGWTGINLEPLQSCYERLYKLRERDINLLVCAGNIDGAVRFYEIPERSSSTMDQTIADLAKRAGWQVLERRNEVLTLNTVLERYSQGRAIHFLKLDVEGSTKAVLEGLDLSRWRPWIILIDTTVFFSKHLDCADWEEILRGSNYQLAYFDGANRFYVAEEQSGLMNSLKIAPDFVDNFIVDGHYYIESDRDSLHNELERIRTEREALKSEWDRVRVQRDKLRVERDALKFALNEIHNRPSWHLAVSLQSMIGDGKTAIILNRLFPLRTLPRRITFKMIRLTRNGLAARPAINRLVSSIFHPFSTLTNRLENWASQIDQAPPDSLVSNNDLVMSPQVKKIYLDLVNATQTRRE